MCKLIGEAPTNMRDFVKLHAAEFKHRGRRIPEAFSTQVMAKHPASPFLNQTRPASGTTHESPLNETWY